MVVFISQAVTADVLVKVEADSQGKKFEGIGALSAGASSRLLMEYPEPQRSRILDFLFKPKFGASFQHLKVEIGGDVNSTDGTEPSHARTREEFDHPKSEYYNRGYEWWLLREAKKRNPRIYLDALQWGAPGWIGGVGDNRKRFFSQDNAEFIASFIQGAKRYHHVGIDYCGIWNETPHDPEWIKLLRQTLDRRGLSSVQIVAADETGANEWDIAKEMHADKELMNAVQVIGAHYPQFRSAPEALQTGKPVWSSEDGPWRGDWQGACALARMFNRNYARGKMTKTVIWSLITSYYDILPLPNSGPMMAKEPWSGHYEAQPATWAIAHTTQFAQPGWKYVDSGCGLLPGGGSFVTLRAPGSSGDYSVIIETTDAKQPQTLTLQVGDGMSQQPLHAWRSDKQEQFARLEDLRVAKRIASITVQPGAIYSLTTTAGQKKASAASPPGSEFPLPYVDTFESYATGKYARYFSDQGGVFEVARRPDGKGKCLRQVLAHNGIDWHFHITPEPYSIIGSPRWSDYEVSADVLPEDSGFASLWGRITASLQNAQPAKGYWLKLSAAGQWQLNAFTNVLAEGQVALGPERWHNLKLRFTGSQIVALLDGEELKTVKDEAFRQGMVALGTGWNRAMFDNFSIQPVGSSDLEQRRPGKHVRRFRSD